MLLGYARTAQNGRQALRMAQVGLEGGERMDLEDPPEGDVVCKGEKKENKMSKWLNNTKQTHKPNEITKPCRSCGYCPYGQLVEEYPLSDSEISCEVFGHDCPVYYMAEFITEEQWGDGYRGTLISRFDDNHYATKFQKADKKDRCSNGS